MKKNHIVLALLILVTIIVTLSLSVIYRQKFSITAYSFDRLNKITAEEFNEYMIENPNVIIYIGDKTNYTYNKIEKKFINKLEKSNLLESTIYIEKEEVKTKLSKILKENYKYTYNENKLPVILVIIDGEVIQTENLTKTSNPETIINYEVFEW